MNKNAFFKVVNEFITGMMRTCPEIRRELTKLETFIDIGQNTMPRLIIQEFMNKIEPYYKHILEHNEEYFRMEIDYEQTFETTCQNYSASDKIKTFIDNLLRFIGREWEKSLSDRHKLEIWGYLSSIIVIGAVYLGSDYKHIVEYAEYVEQQRAADAAASRQQ